ncbi:MAG TPA: 30S ribosome-binding factor RbfA [Candidatus Acidoferrales bacterium]|jgi:ribosome-binding factor A|nr:30S ribosome-binding factor RbfA [Candidatus Acidoferrales bacterium]
MHAAGHRHERIAEEIHHEVDSMLAGELRDPRLEASIMVTEVRLQPDMKLARIFVTIIGTPQEQSDALAALAKATGYIRHELTERIQMRRSPDLQFLMDTSEEQARRIDELLRQSKPPDKSGSGPDNPSEQS